MLDGYIKFNCKWIQLPRVSSADIESVNLWRNKLYHLNLIGAYPDGIGYGNISIRHTPHFIISGSATGNLPFLNENQYVLVTEYSLFDNRLSCEGMVKASSESLTHATVYDCALSVQAVIHVHNLSLWKRLLYIVPTTRADVSYGTPEMALEIQRLFKETSIATGKIMVMAGHQEGILSFGNSLEEAGNVLLKHFQQL